MQTLFLFISYAHHMEMVKVKTDLVNWFFYIVVSGAIVTFFWVKCFIYYVDTHGVCMVNMTKIYICFFFHHLVELQNCYMNFVFKLLIDFWCYSASKVEWIKSEIKFI